ncbi:Panacea domain-containing protein [Pantoea sp. UBA6567]|uniref:Panacea domain-containing protein n=1 Tax=Pantoea sp. UBA6567 TaxID=1947043 RepID=UPI002598CB2C|nr:type II toxin-antitoxin system antitoxin SocA domain-containing protein [Pantoea sp. UBA6567]
MFSSEQIANKFIELALSQGSPITPMQAQKLTYIAHGISLGHRGTGLLQEPVSAWRYGPVTPSLYHALKRYRSSPITNKVPDYGYFKPDPALDVYANQVVKAVYDTYGRYSGEVLSEFTHREGTPWHQTYTSGQSIISDGVISDYYKRLMSKDPTCIGL